MARRRPKETDGAASARAKNNSDNGANLGFEAWMFLAADTLRKTLAPSDYQHVALGLIFLRPISNAVSAYAAQGRCGAFPGAEPVYAMKKERDR